MVYPYTAQSAEPRKKVYTILEGDGICETCYRRNQEERMQKNQKEITLLEIRDIVKEILKKLNKQQNTE